MKYVVYKEEGELCKRTIEAILSSDREADVLCEMLMKNRSYGDYSTQYFYTSVPETFDEYIEHNWIAAGLVESARDSLKNGDNFYFGR